MSDTNERPDEAEERKPPQAPGAGADLTHWIFGSLGQRGRVRGSIQFDVERIEGDARDAGADGTPEARAENGARADDAQAVHPAPGDAVQVTGSPQSDASLDAASSTDAESEGAGTDGAVGAGEASTAEEQAPHVGETEDERALVDRVVVESIDSEPCPELELPPTTLEDRDLVDCIREDEESIEVCEAIDVPFAVSDGEAIQLPALCRDGAAELENPDDAVRREPCSPSDAAEHGDAARDPAGDAAAADDDAASRIDSESAEELFAWLDDIDVSSAREEESSEEAEDEDEAALVDKVAPELEAPTEQRFVETLLETLLLLGLVVCGELAITGKVGSFGVHPHPYWLVVVPMAAARGLIGALIAAGAASFFFAMGARAAHGGDFLVVTDLRVMQEAMLFFAVGFVIGEFRDAARRTWRALWDAFVQREEELVLLRRERELLTEANHVIKRRLVDNASQFGNLIRTATRLEAADEVELFDVALEMIEEHCGATHCAILAVLEGGLLDLAAYRGYREEELRELLAGAESSPLVARVLESGRRINGFGAQEDIIGEGPIVVCPIADATGVVRQLLCLDRIPVRAFNDSTVMTFYGIADWVAVTLRRASHGNQALDFRLGLREAISIGPWIGNSGQLAERIRIEDARCSRQGILSAAVTVQCIGVPEDRQEDVDSWVLDHLLSDLRPTDGLYRFGYPGCYVFVLSGTDTIQCQIVRQRVEDRISRFEDLFFDSWKTGAFAPDTESPDLRSLLPRIAAHFREHSEYSLDSELPISVEDRIEIGRLDDFVRRVRTEWSIAIRNEIELYVLEFRDDDADAKRGNVLARHVEAVARDLLRPTDGVYRSAIARFSIVLPGTSCEGAFGALSRFLEALEQRANAGVIGSVEAQVYALGSDYDEYERFLARMLGDNLSAEFEPAASAVGIDAVFDAMDPVATPLVDELKEVVEEATEEVAEEAEEAERERVVETVLRDPFQEDCPFDLIDDDPTLDIIDELFADACDETPSAETPAPTLHRERQAEPEQDPVPEPEPEPVQAPSSGRSEDKKSGVRAARRPASEDGLGDALDALASLKGQFARTKEDEQSPERARTIDFETAIDAPDFSGIDEDAFDLDDDAIDLEDFE